MLYVGGYGPDAALILRTARELGDDLQLIGGDGVGMDGFWSIAGDLGERTIFSDRPEHATGPTQRRSSSGFKAADWAHAWAASRRMPRFRCGPGGRARRHVRVGSGREMLRRGRFETVVGRVTFDHKGDLEGAVWQWKLWTGGDYVPLDRLVSQ